MTKFYNISKLNNELIDVIIKEYGYGKLCYFINKDIELHELDNNNHIIFSYQNVKFSDMMKMFNISIRMVGEFLKNEDKPILIIRRNKKPIQILYRFI